MTYNKKQYLNKINIFSILAMLVVLIFFGFLYINYKNSQVKELAWGTLLEKTDIKGISKQIDKDWNLYTNKALGFQFEYPRREFPYGMLQVREDKSFLNSYPEKKFPYYIFKMIIGESFLSNGLYIEKIPYISVGIHPKDSQGIGVYIAQPKFNNLDDYVDDFIKNSQIPSQPKIEYETKKIKISGYDAVLIYYKTLNNDGLSDENIQKNIYVIKDGVGYLIINYYLTSEENNHIWNSFKFLD